MNTLLKKEVSFLLVVLMFAPIFAQPGMALDHLVLTGFLRSFDLSSGIARIDVTSEGCKGLREFKLPDDAKGDIDKKLIGKLFTFQIDSAICERGRIYNIVSGGK